MSDTTITPEEMAEIRMVAARKGMLSHKDGIHEKLTRLLNALEQAEAKNTRLRALVAALDELKNAEKNFIRLQQTKRESDEGWRLDVDCSGIKRRIRAARVRFATARKAVEAARRAVAAGEGTCQK